MVNINEVNSKEDIDLDNMTPEKALEILYKNILSLKTMDKNNYIIVALKNCMQNIKLEDVYHYP